MFSKQWYTEQFNHMQFHEESVNRDVRSSHAFHIAFQQSHLASTWFYAISLLPSDTDVPFHKKNERKKAKDLKYGPEHPTMPWTSFAAVSFLQVDWCLQYLPAGGDASGELKSSG